jgi:hypothetical protein
MSTKMATIATFFVVTGGYVAMSLALLLKYYSGDESMLKHRLQQPKKKMAAKDYYTVLNLRMMMLWISIGLGEKDCMTVLILLQLIV